MADQKLTELSEVTTVSSADLMYLVADTETTPASRRISWLNILAALNAALGFVPTTRTVNSKALSSNITLSTADVAATTDKNYVTDAQVTLLGNTSGTNTGDETVTTIKTKLGITTLSGSNTGDQTLPTDATLSVSDVTTNNVDNNKHGFFPKLPSVSDNKNYGIKNGAVSEIVSGGASSTRGTFTTSNLTYTFTVATPSVSPTAGATYTNNGITYTVVSYSSNSLVCTGTGYPTASGTLTKASGTGDATLTFTAFTATYTITHSLALSSPYIIIVTLSNTSTNKKIGDPDDITYATNSFTIDVTSFTTLTSFGYAYLAG